MKKACLPLPSPNFCWLLSAGGCIILATVAVPHFTSAANATKNPANQPALRSGAPTTKSAAVVPPRVRLSQATAGAAPAPVTGKAAVSPQIRYVAAGMEDARKKLLIGSCLVTRSTFTPLAMLKASHTNFSSVPGATVGPEPTADRAFKSSIWWYKRNDMVSVDVQHEPAKDGRIATESLRTTPEEVLFLEGYLDKNPAKSKYYFGSVAEYGEDVTHGLHKKTAVYDPRYYGYYWGTYPVDSLLIKNTGNSALDNELPVAEYVGEEEIYGAKCVVIKQPQFDGEGYWKYWVDTEHGFLIRRMWSYKTQGGKDQLYTTSEIPKVVQSGEVWLPAAATSKIYSEIVRDPAGKTEDEKMWHSTVEVSLSQLEIPGKFPPGSFEMRWPLGTNITDKRTNKSFLIVQQKS